MPQPWRWEVTQGSLGRGHRSLFAGHALDGSAGALKPGGSAHFPCVFRKRNGRFFIVIEYTEYEIYPFSHLKKKNNIENIKKSGAATAVHSHGCVTVTSAWFQGFSLPPK